MTGAGAFHTSGAMGRWHDHGTVEESGPAKISPQQGRIFARFLFFYGAPEDWIAETDGPFPGIDALRGLG